MQKKIQWPDNKKFAFTIIDDTDNATVENIKPIYDLLYEKKLLTTKTVWVYDSRDHFSGSSLQDDNYLNFIKELKDHGFEIQLHNVGSGSFLSDEIQQGLELFNRLMGYYPSMHINHSFNPDNMYWGYKRYSPFYAAILRIVYGKKRRFYGDEKSSKHFWGDLHKKHIKYTRNRVFNDINTLRQDPKMPFKEKSKPLANYLFSSSDGHTLEEFNALISKKNIDRLEKEGGFCIVYTHFASGFIDANGNIDADFENKINYLASKNGWFVPASEILDFLLLEKKGTEYTNLWYTFFLDTKWFIQRIIKKIKFGR
jgi:hypothetical protein